MNDLFKSKRFWLAIAGVISAVLADKLPIDQEQVQQIVMVIAAWIVGDSLRSTSQPQGLNRVR